jgi:arylsulfatase A-like enzyme
MYRNNSPTTEDKGTYCTHLFKREALRFIGEHKDGPFFCDVAFNAPHMASTLDDPKTVQAPDEYRKRYPAPKTAKEKTRVNYMAAVTCMDDAIGELLKRLDEIGQADNTIVVFMSDNGGAGGGDNAPLRGGKSQMFEGGLRVPCIVRWPGVVRPGTVCDEFLTAMDILPTLCMAAGAQPPRGVILDGFDIAAVLAGKAKSPRREMFWERQADRAARVGNWKWVESARGGGLFDLSTDIGEQHDLSKEKPDMLEMVKSRFAAWKKQMDEAEPRGPFRNF